MRATSFEKRHAGFLRLCIYAGAFSAYFLDPDDVVWRFIRNFPSRRALEHGAFLIATLMIGAGAWLCTRAQACAARPGSSPRSTGLLGEWLYATGMSTLAPLWGCIVLLAGESVRILRLSGTKRNGPADEPRDGAPRWSYAIRRQGTKWGVLATMVVFTVTLIDRVADYGIAASVILWAVLNATSTLRRGA